MNRRSLIATLVAVFAPALPARAAPQPDWKLYEWGREIIFCDGVVSFAALPLLDGERPESLVVNLQLTHVNYGARAICEARVAELVSFHVGRPAAHLAVMSRRELNYQNTPR